MKKKHDGHIHVSNLGHALCIDDGVHFDIDDVGRVYTDDIGHRWRHFAETSQKDKERPDVRETSKTPQETSTVGPP